MFLLDGAAPALGTSDPARALEGGKGQAFSPAALPHERASGWQAVLRPAVCTLQAARQPDLGLQSPLPDDGFTVQHLNSHSTEWHTELRFSTHWPEALALCSVLSGF